MFLERVPASSKRKSGITSLQHCPAPLLSRLPCDLVEESKTQARLLLPRHVEGPILQPPLKCENVDIRRPLVSTDNDYMALLMEAKKQGQAVNVADRGEGVRNRDEAPEGDDGEEQSYGS